MSEAARNEGLQLNGGRGRRGAAAGAWIIADVDKITACGRDRQGEDQGQARSHIERIRSSANVPSPPCLAKVGYRFGLSDISRSGGFPVSRPRAYTPSAAAAFS